MKYIKETFVKATFIKNVYTISIKDKNWIILMPNINKQNNFISIKLFNFLIIFKEKR